MSARLLSMSRSKINDPINISSSLQSSKSPGAVDEILPIPSTMASALSISISLECMNRCGSGRCECSVLSCAWKALRAITGSLASTPLPQCSSHHRLRGRRNCHHRVFPFCLMDIERDYLSLNQRYPMLAISPDFSKPLQESWDELANTLSYVAG